MVFRQQTFTIQGVLTATPGSAATNEGHEISSKHSLVYKHEPLETLLTIKDKTFQENGVSPPNSKFAEITEQMVRAVEHYPTETIVLVTGMVRKPPTPVKATTVHDAEIGIQEIHVISRVTENVPFTVYDAENILELDSESDDEDTDPGNPIPNGDDTSSKG